MMAPKPLDFLENEANQPAPRLAVLDVKMPLKNGFDVLADVRRNLKLRFMPVIMFSSSNHERDVNRAYELGANSYVVKPGNPKRMDVVITKLQEYWVNVNE